MGHLLDEPIAGPKVNSEIRASRERERERWGLVDDQLEGRQRSEGRQGTSWEKRHLDPHYLAKTIKYTRQHDRGGTGWTGCVGLD